MGKFDAKDSVDQMEYDFTAFGGSAGVIPEPTNDQIRKYQQAMIRIWKPAAELAAAQSADTGKTDAERLREAVELTEAAMDEGTDQDQVQEFLVELATLCSNTPSLEDLNKLPYRVRLAFQAWILGELTPKG